MAEEYFQKQLSIIVISNGSGAALERCLHSIYKNENPANVEIIVSAYVSDDLVLNLLNSFPEVHFILFREKTGIPSLAAAGIKKSECEIIALTDSSCIVDKNWIASMLRAHQSSRKIFGGVVKASVKMKSLDLAAYFCEYGLFAPPLAAGTTNILPGNNISFKRSLLKIGSEFIEPKFWKTFWCEKLEKAGVQLTSEPEICVSYAKTFSFGAFLIRRFQHGRCFAGMRIESATVSKRSFFVAGSIFLPFIFFYRTISVILRKNQFANDIIRSLPYIAAAILSWSLGEFCGYLAGTGKSCDYIE